MERPLHGWLDPGDLGLRAVAVVDGHYGNTGGEVLFEIAHGPLVARHPAAAVDEEQQRRRFCRFGLVEVEHLPLVIAVGHVG